MQIYFLSTKFQSCSNGSVGYWESFRFKAQQSVKFYCLVKVSDRQDQVVQKLDFGLRRVFHV